MKKYLEKTKKFLIEFQYPVYGECEVEATSEEEAHEIIGSAVLGDEEGITNCSSSNGDWEVMDIEEVKKKK